MSKAKLNLQKEMMRASTHRNALIGILDVVQSDPSVIIPNSGVILEIKSMIEREEKNIRHGYHGLSQIDEADEREES